MGGTDVAENLVEINVTQHAMYHFCNYQLWGNEEDKIAWLGLSNSINPTEASLLAHKFGVEKSRTPEAIEKKKKKLKEIEHQKGEKNSQYGKMWITNGTKEGTYRINKEEPIPEGHWKGRVCFDVKPKGKTASAYGRMWINNGSKNKMIPKESPIPEGYKKGRFVLK